MELKAELFGNLDKRVLTEEQKEAVRISEVVSAVMNILAVRTKVEYNRLALNQFFLEQSSAPVNTLMEESMNFLYVNVVESIIKTSAIRLAELGIEKPIGRESWVPFFVPRILQNLQLFNGITEKFGTTVGELLQLLKQASSPGRWFQYAQTGELQED